MTSLSCGTSPVCLHLVVLPCLPCRQHHLRGAELIPSIPAAAADLGAAGMPCHPFTGVICDMSAAAFCPAGQPDVWQHRGGGALRAQPWRLLPVQLHAPCSWAVRAGGHQWRQAPEGQPLCCAGARAGACLPESVAMHAGYATLPVAHTTGSRLTARQALPGLLGRSSRLPP